MKQINKFPNLIDYASHSGSEDNSVTEVPSVPLEAAAPDKVESKINENHKNEAQIEWEENEVKNDEIKEDILWQAEQVVHHATGICKEVVKLNNCPM